MRGDVQVVDDVSTAFAELVVRERPSSVALSGGDTARAAYARLAEAPDRVPWSAIDVFFGDERWVDVSDPDSNEGTARRTLLDHVAVRSVVSMRNAGPTIEEAAASYDVFVRARQAIDLVHLGVGSDGHTASLFPDSPQLLERERLVVPAGDDTHPHPRLTLTYPALARARLVVFTVAGAAKRAIWERLRAGEDLPAAQVDAERIVWLVDPAAVGAR